MFRSLLGYTVKPPSHEDSEKELAEVLDLFSKHSLYLEESEKREFKNEYDRLQHEIRLYNAVKSAEKPKNVDMVLTDSRALKCKVKKTIVAAVGTRAAAPMSAGEDSLEEVQATPPLAPPAIDPSQPTSDHPVDPPSVATNASLHTPTSTSSTNNEGRLEPQSNPSVKADRSLPERHPIRAQMNSRQAASLLRSGISYQVDSMIMDGANVRLPTANIDSPGSTGATIISHGPQVAQRVPQPARPRRATRRRTQQQPGSFLSGGYVSNGSIICSNSRVEGATLNVNSTNSSGAVIHRFRRPA
ncbi:hypothetical protein M405DRAFT_819544 [Rhizopogon salebrosus TDB-379]|nr:hypothetical protein M405DRAFT_819544 [Rhizopogon salebrosus TDB-379]